MGSSASVDCTRDVRFGVGLTVINFSLQACVGPPLCLSPDPGLARIANHVNNDTSLPLPPYFPARAQPLEELVKEAKKAIKGAAGEPTSAAVAESESKDSVPGLAEGTAKKRKASKGKTNRTGGRDINGDAQELEAAIDQAAVEAANQELERKEAEQWMLVMDESLNRVFQPR